MKKLIINSYYLVIVFLIFAILYGCEKSEITDNFEVYDNLVFNDHRVVFSTSSPWYSYDGIKSLLTISATITVPDDINITDFGFCWEVYKNYNKPPTVYDKKKSFGPTSLKNLTFSTTFEDAALSLYGKFFYRAYIITNNGVIYDTPNYHKW